MEFKHPKYYKELRKRNKLAESRQPVVGGQQTDQVISKSSRDGESERAPGPGHKQQAASDSQVVNQVKLSSQSQASSSKLRYTPTGILLGVDLGPKPQAASKPEPVQVQASSAKRQASQPE